MKEMQKEFLKDKPKIEPQSFFMAKLNHENQTGNAIARRMLKTKLF